MFLNNYLIRGFHKLSPMLQKLHEQNSSPGMLPQEVVRRKFLPIHPSAPCASLKSGLEDWRTFQNSVESSRESCQGKKESAKIASYPSTHWNHCIKSPSILERPILGPSICQKSWRINDSYQRIDREAMLNNYQTFKKKSS